MARASLVQNATKKKHLLLHKITVVKENSVKEIMDQN
jgi:hypothetical protein